MNNLFTHLCGIKDWPILQEIGIRTYSDTFQQKNTPENFNQYIKQAFSKKRIKKELQNPNSEFYLFYLNDELIGYLKINEGDAQTEDQDHHSLEIERIYLYQQFQGKGYGKTMLNHTIQLAMEINKSRVWLGVWEENPTAINFYKKMGFVEFGRHIFTMGNDDQTDLMMELRI
jgi:ribosomal protein S18 acetylase RimI-like enzyme